MKFLSSTQISLLLQVLDRVQPGGINSLPDLCALLSSGSNPALTELVLLLVARTLGETGADQLIQCLIDAGIAPPVRG